MKKLLLSVLILLATCNNLSNVSEQNEWKISADFIHPFDPYQRYKYREALIITKNIGSTVLDSAIQIDLNATIEASIAPKCSLIIYISAYDRDVHSTIQEEYRLIAYKPNLHLHLGIPIETIEK